MEVFLPTGRQLVVPDEAMQGEQGTTQGTEQGPQSGIGAPATGGRRGDTLAVERGDCLQTRMQSAKRALFSLAHATVASEDDTDKRIAARPREGLPLRRPHAYDTVYDILPGSHLGQCYVALAVCLCGAQDKRVPPGLYPRPHARAGGW